MLHFTKAEPDSELPLLVGAEAEAEAEKHIHRSSSPQSRTWKVLQPLICFALGVAATILFNSTLSNTTTTTTTAQAQNTCEQNTSSTDTPVPFIPYERVTFQPNATFQSPHELEGAYAWNALLPEGRGFVFVPDAARFALPPGEATAHGPIYSVSLFHQLHCLSEIRGAYWLLLNGVELRDPLQGAHLLGARGEHVWHCLDYVRQGVMCAGDMTLEWPRREGEGKGFAVDGWGVTHRCRSWDAIQEYMTQAHFNESMTGTNGR